MAHKWLCLWFCTTFYNSVLQGFFCQQWQNISMEFIFLEESRGLSFIWTFTLNSNQCSLNSIFNYHVGMFSLCVTMGPSLSPLLKPTRRCLLVTRLTCKEYAKSLSNESFPFSTRTEKDNTWIQDSSLLVTIRKVFIKSLEDNNIGE